MVDSRSRTAIGLLIGLVLAVGSPGRGALAEPPAAASVEERFRALRGGREAVWDASARAIDRVGDVDERRRLEQAWEAAEAAYATRFLELAREDPDGPVAADALHDAIQAGGRGPEAREAIDQLRRGFAASPKMSWIVQQIAMSPCPGVEDLLREVLARNPDRTARGLACHGLADLLAREADLPRLRDQDAETARALERIYGPANLDRMARRDAEALLREAEELHRRVLAEYADVRTFPMDPDDERTVGRSSETWLAARRELAVGRPAPEIEGEDLDGKPLKLSDHRGKVVVVVFWASWCGPCMAQVPHERALAERLKGKPFALLGVNGDRSVEAARAAVSKAAINWPNRFDGDPNEGPIAARWRVQSLPRIFVLDAGGVIRFHDVRGRALDDAVDVLLAEMPPAE